MSRLFNSDTVVCVPAVWGTDNKGNQLWLPGTEEYMVPADVQPATNTVETVEGQRVEETVNVYARSLPFTETRFMQVKWNGDTWNVLGSVKVFKQGRRTGHVEWQMTKRGARNG